MINYIKGDATNPIGDGNKIIAHICNNVGAWGAGFVLAISKKWKEPEKRFKLWSSFGKPPELGEVQFVSVEEDIMVANMIGQDGIRTGNLNPTPIRYSAVEDCLQLVYERAITTGSSVHMPRIGTGLAGGKWHIIEPMIIKKLSEKNINVYVYDLI